MLKLKKEEIPMIKLSDINKAGDLLKKSSRQTL